MKIVPQEGQVVLVRGEHWAVSEVKLQALPRSAADDVSDVQHLLLLSSLAEDRLGDEIKVIWELEIGSVVLPDIGLPNVQADKFDDPQKFAAFLDALRWGAVTTADSKTLQAPFRSGALIEPYQLEPVKRAIANARANMLLADDVGLGKTIEAGLVIQELLLRHRARTVCIVCPASLSNKWQDEMREKFGLDFQIINSETLREVRRSHGLHVNPFRLFPRIIVSMQWLPGERAQRLVSEIYESVDKQESGRANAFDILVVDEAHHVAPASPQQSCKNRRGYSLDTLRTKAVRALSERSNHRLFLTATPHNGYTESFTALLEMVDSRRFVRGASVDKKNLSEVVVRRLKKHLSAAGVKSFPPRLVKTLEFNPNEIENNNYEKLEIFLKNRNQQLRENKANDMATLLLKKRFLSSPYSFAGTIDTYLNSRGGLEDEYLNYDEVLGEQADDLEEGLIDQNEANALRAAKKKLPDLKPDDKKLLEELYKWARSYDSKPDSRLKVLIEYINSVVKDTKNEYTNERIVIFSEYVDTINWIQSNLTQLGFDDTRVSKIIGSTDEDERENIKAKFQESPELQPLRILLATDAAGEGIDLQKYCHRLVNYDIPFNPNRLEQRAGRVDRYGQKKPPEIYHFSVNTKENIGFPGDLEMLARIAKRIITQEEDLGSINPVIAEEIQFKLLGKATKKIEPAKKDENLINEVMQGEREVSKALTELGNDFGASLDALHVRPSNLKRVVETAFELDNQSELKTVLDPISKKQVFRISKLSLPWEAATRGLPNRLTPDLWRPVTFDPEILEDRTDLVYAHLGHPLLQRSARLLRSAVWNPNFPLNRVTAVEVSELKESVVAAVTRLVIVGKGGVRLHEEIFLAGARLNGGKLLGKDTSEEILIKALDGDKLSNVDSKIKLKMQKIWEDQKSEKSLKNRIELAVSERAELRKQEVLSALKVKEDEDLKRVSQIYTRFKDILLKSLEEASEQLEEALGQLFDEEKQQRAQDVARWSQRLDTLKQEETRELDSVKKRYEDPQHYEFAAALVFALTPSDAKP